MIRVLSLLLAAVLGALPLTMASTPQAAAEEEACAPFDLTDTDQLRAALEASNTVFEGRVRSRQREESATGEVQLVHTVRVRVAYAGRFAADDEVEVVTLRGRDGGLGRLDQGRHLIFAEEQEDGTVVSGPCSGTTPLDQALTGAEVSLIETHLEGASPAAGPRSVEFSEPISGVPPRPSLGRLIAPAAALGLIGVLGLLLTIAIGARRPH